MIVADAASVGGRRKLRRPREIFDNSDELYSPRELLRSPTGAGEAQLCGDCSWVARYDANESVRRGRRSGGGSPRVSERPAYTGTKQSFERRVPKRSLGTRMLGTRTLGTRTIEDERGQIDRFYGAAPNLWMNSRGFLIDSECDPPPNLWETDRFYGPQDRIYGAFSHPVVEVCQKMRRAVADRHPSIVAIAPGGMMFHNICRI